MMLWAGAMGAGTMGMIDKHAGKMLPACTALTAPLGDTP